MPHTPRILVVEHEAKCPPARFGAWLDEAGCRVEVCRPYDGDPLPADLDDHDGLVVLGGSMSAHDDDTHPWLPPLKELVRGAARDDVATLGICLGHQVVTLALGGDVKQNPLGQQLGVLDLGWLPAAADDPLVGPIAGAPARGIQWNDHVVTLLPEGAEVLARTDRDELQAVRFTATVWGLQLHPEADTEVVREWALGDAERHAARGVDTVALVAGIEAARDELDRTWRPVARAFARLAGIRG